MRPVAILFTFLVYAGVFLNGSVILGVLRKLWWRSTDFYPLRALDFIILNMAIADFFVSFAFTISMPATGGDLSQSHSLCQFSGFFFATFTTLSLVSMWLLAHYRYRMIVKEKEMSLREVLYSVIGLWVFALTFGISNLLLDNIKVFPAKITCYAAIGTDTAPHIYGGIFIICIGLVPLIGIAYAYTRIQIYASKELYQAPSFVITTDTRKACVPSTRAQRRLKWMTTMLTLTYLFAVLPFVTVSIYRLITGEAAPAADAVMRLSFLNYDGNPILYFVFQKRYRNAVFELFGLQRLVSRLSNDRSKPTPPAAATRIQVSAVGDRERSAHRKKPSSSRSWIISVSGDTLRENASTCSDASLYRSMKGGGANLSEKSHSNTNLSERSIHRRASDSTGADHDCTMQDNSSCEHEVERSVHSNLDADSDPNTEVSVKEGPGVRSHLSHEVERSVTSNLQLDATSDSSTEVSVKEGSGVRTYFSHEAERSVTSNLDADSDSRTEVSVKEGSS